jgi:hypothetical protein
MRRWHALTLVRRAPQMSAADLLDPLPEVAGKRSKMARKIHICTHSAPSSAAGFLTSGRGRSDRPWRCSPRSAPDTPIAPERRRSVALYLAMLETVLGQRPRRD